MPEWDEIFREKGLVFTEPHSDMPKIAEIFRERKVQRVLDLGCGTGRHLLFFSQLGFEMYGFDASSQAISLAGDWLKKEGFATRILVHKMQEQFPYETDFFDAIISVQVIHHNLMKDIKVTISEIDRVLSPGGLIFISVPVLLMGPVEKDKDWELEEIEEGTYIPHSGPESGIPHHYFTEEEIYETFHFCTIEEMYIDDTGHRCFLGMKTSSKV